MGRLMRTLCTGGGFCWVGLDGSGCSKTTSFTSSNSFSNRRERGFICFFFEGFGEGFLLTSGPVKRCPNFILLKVATMSSATMSRTRFSWTRSLRWHFSYLNRNCGRVLCNVLGDEVCIRCRIACGDDSCGGSIQETMTFLVG